MGFSCWKNKSNSYKPQKKCALLGFTSKSVNFKKYTLHYKSKFTILNYCVFGNFSYMFASASPDNIKQWTCPDGKFVQNLTGHNAIVNCMAVNSDGVLMSGANNGSIYAWDWRTGYNFQRMQVL